MISKSFLNEELAFEAIRDTERLTGGDKQYAFSLSPKKGVLPAS
jgi:hypothetical protein